MPGILGRWAQNLSANRAAFSRHIPQPPPLPAGTVAAVKTRAYSRLLAPLLGPLFSALPAKLFARLVATQPARLVGLASLALAFAALAASRDAAAQSQATAAYTPPPATLAQAVALVQQAATVLAPAGARVVVQPGALDTRLQLAPCAAIAPYLQSGAPAWGRTRVGLRCTQGANWNVQLPVTVQVFAPALVLATALPAGSKLDGKLDKKTDG